MSYDFTKGKYRAFIRTTYLDESGTNQTIDGEPEVFDSEAVSYLTFRTNNLIKIDPETLEVPNAELTDSGTYKGLEYSLYDNGLAVVSGIQDEAIVSADEKPWAVEGIEYIYAKATFCSGNVFRTDYGKELQFGTCGFASGTANATTLFFGRNWDFINFSRVNWSNLGSYSSILNTWTKAEEGFQNFINYVFTQTQVTSLSGLFGPLRISEGVETININVPSRIVGGSYAFMSFGGPGVTVNLHMESFIDLSTYGFGPCGRLNLEIDDPIDTDSVSLLVGSDVKNLYADISLGSTVTRLPFINDNAELLSIEFGSSFDTSLISNFTNAFSNNPKLIDVSGNGGNPFDLTSAKSFRSMFESDSDLVSIGHDSTSQLLIDTNIRYVDYMKMFKGCSSFHRSVKIIDRTGYIMSMESAFEESGIENFEFEQYGTSGRMTQIMSDDFSYMLRNASNLESVLMTFHDTAAVANIRYWNMCEGCDSLEEVYINGVYFYDSSTGYQYTGIDLPKAMFKNCSSLKTLSFYECAIASDSSADLTDMFTGCNALETISFSSNAACRTVALPKTMYLNGTAVNSITKYRGSQAVYTSTP